MLYFAPAFAMLSMAEAKTGWGGPPKTMGTLASAMKSPGPNMSAETPGIEAISSTFAMPFTLSIWGIMAMWLLEVFMLKASSGYRERSETPGVKVQGLNERAPTGAVFVCKLNWLQGFLLILYIRAVDTYGSTSSA